MGQYYIGVMTGTSCDAIDTVLVKFTNGQINILASNSQSIDTSLRQKILAMNAPDFSDVAAIYEADVALGQAYARTILELLQHNKIPAEKVIAIGLHGQTIRHQPNASLPHTVQIGDPNIVALETKISTIADFRRKDIANGGQGAPFAPLFHQHFFADENEVRVVLNLGGIANISILKPGEPIIGFDTGPANALLDAWIEQHQNRPFDDKGEWARSGKTDSVLLKKLLNDPYFLQTYPKSTGRDYFNLAWLNTQLDNEVSAVDVQNTLTELTAQSIIKAIASTATMPEKIIVCGGGAQNIFLLECLQLKTNANVLTSEQLGINPNLVEPLTFAWLAKQRVEEQSVDLRSITGARQPSVLGAMYI